MNEKNKIRASKFMSLVLRHNPSAGNLEMDAYGFVAVESLLKALSKRGLGVMRAELDELVATNNKRRFAFSECGTKIRAVQGHSIPIDLGYEVREPPEVLYHGTVERELNNIFSKGLLSMSRQHVHLSVDIETALSVGKRHGSGVIVLIVRARDMYEAGHSFYLADNGVWLADHVSSDFIEMQ